MTQKNMTDLECKDTVYITPPPISDAVRSYFPGGMIPFDAATEQNNPLGALRFCAGAGSPLPSIGDGLTTQWFDQGGTFVNPPYGRGIRDWCAKIHEETVTGTEIIALLPCGARFSTRYWQDHILNEGLDAVLFVRGRVKFLRPDGSGTQGQNPYDSAIYGYNVDVDRFIKCFRHLGKILQVSMA